jgi:hypothetical protein
MSERQLGRWVGIAGLTSVLLTLAALIASASGAHPASAGGAQAARQLQDFHRLGSTQAIALLLRVAGLVLVIAVGLFWDRAAQRRGARGRPSLAWLSALAPVLLALALTAGFFALGHVAAAFSASGPRTDARAHELIDGSRPLRAAALAEIAARIAFGVWMLALARIAMRAELLTPFLGYFGIGAGIATMVPGLSIGDALFAGWISSLALLALGWWPGGRPPAWESAGRPGAKASRRPRGALGQG